MSRPLSWQEQGEVVDTHWILGLILLRVHSAPLRHSALVPLDWARHRAGIWEEGLCPSLPPVELGDIIVVAHTLLFHTPMPAGAMCHHQPTLPQKEPENLHGDGFLMVWTLQAERITPSDPKPAFALHFPGDSLWMLHWLLNSAKSWRWS